MSTNNWAPQSNAFGNNTPAAPAQPAAPVTLRDHLLARLEQQQRGNFEIDLGNGDKRIMKHAVNGTVTTKQIHSVDYVPNEHVLHNVDAMLASVETLDGNPAQLPDSADADLNGFTVLVTMPSGDQARMRASRAVEIGALKWQQPGTPAQPAVTPTTQPAVQKEAAGDAEINGKPAGQTEKSPGELAREQTFTEQNVGDLQAAAEALTKAGIDPNVETLRAIQSGEMSLAAVNAIAATLNVKPDDVGAWIQSVSNELVGHVSEVLMAQGFDQPSELIAEVSEKHPQQWAGASLAALQSNSVVPLLKLMASHVEQDNVWK